MRFVYSLGEGIKLLEYKQNFSKNLFGSSFPEIILNKKKNGETIIKINPINS